MHPVKWHREEKPPSLAVTTSESDNTSDDDADPLGTRALNPFLPTEPNLPPKSIFDEPMLIPTLLL